LAIGYGQDCRLRLLMTNEGSVVIGITAERQKVRYVINTKLGTTHPPNIINPVVFTVLCQAERGIAKASCPSVCLSVTLKYRGHMG